MSHVDFTSCTSCGLPKMKTMTQNEARKREKKKEKKIWKQMTGYETDNISFSGNMFSSRGRRVCLFICLTYMNESSSLFAEKSATTKLQKYLLQNFILFFSS